jgi:hypothetical protein
MKQILICFAAEQEGVLVLGREPYSSFQRQEVQMYI